MKIIIHEHKGNCTKKSEKKTKTNTLKTTPYPDEVMHLIQQMRDECKAYVDCALEMQTQKHHLEISLLKQELAHMSAHTYLPSQTKLGTHTRFNWESESESDYSSLEHSLINNFDTDTVNNVVEMNVVKESDVKETQVVEEPEIKETQLVDVVKESEIKETQVVEEPEIKETQVVEESEIKETQVVEESEVKETQLVEESEIKETQVVEESEIKETQVVEDSEVKETQVVDESDVKETQVVEESEVKETAVVDEYEDEELEEIEYDGRDYYIGCTSNIIYEVNEQGDPGKRVGVLNEDDEFIFDN